MTAQAKVGQNLKYDASVLANHGITLRGIRFRHHARVLRAGLHGTRHDMDSLALKYLGHKTIHFEDMAGKGAKQLTFNQVKLEEAGPTRPRMPISPCACTRPCGPSWRPSPAWLGIQEIEVPLVPVLSRIERQGALLSRSCLRSKARSWAHVCSSCRAGRYELAGQEFNLGSPKQLGEILFEKLELPVIKKTPKGRPSTAEDVLAELALDYPLPKLLLEYRSLSKLKSTYTDKLPEMINPRTGRVHTSYHQAVTATGRLSSSDPNLQNIPIRTEEGRRIRQAFIAPAGYRIVAADYSQIELRIMAHLSG